MFRKKSNKLFLRSFLAFSNVGRGLLTSFFGLLLNYILIHFNSKEVLNSYVYFISIFGLFFNFTNWGGKFFNTKEISKNPQMSKRLISNLISSKIILLFIVCFVVIFIPIQLELKFLLVALLFLKSLVPIFDSLILFRKKSQTVFTVETILSAGFLFLVFDNSNKLSPVTFLVCLIGFELVKFVYYLILFLDEISFCFSTNEAYKILKKSFYFFGVSLAGFIASKSDLYVIGILINKEVMSHYFIISSLSSMCMVVYATLINTFETSIFRFNHKVFQKLETFLKSFGLVFSLLSAIGFYIVTNLFYTIPIDYKFTILFFFNIFLFTLLNFEMYRFTKLEKQNIVLFFLVISGIINCAFSFLFIKQLLLFGAFLANTLGILINYLLMRFYIFKNHTYES